MFAFLFLSSIVFCNTKCVDLDVEDAIDQNDALFDLDAKSGWSAPFYVKSQFRGKLPGDANSKGILMQFNQGVTMISHVNTTASNSDPEFQVQILHSVKFMMSSQFVITWEWQYLSSRTRTPDAVRNGKGSCTCIHKAGTKLKN